MRLTNKFVFVHLPKTGGTWLREVLDQAQLNHFLRSCLLGRGLAVLLSLVPSWRQPILAWLSPLLLLEYSHHRLPQLPADFLSTSPYKQRATTRFSLALLTACGLFKSPPPLAACLVHTRRAQLPAHQINRPILGLINHPLRWHISRFNYYQKGNPQLPHLQFIQDQVGKFTDFRHYCYQQMLEVQHIYYRSYFTYQCQLPPSAPDEFNYPTDVAPWLAEKDPSIRVPKHYGLLSFLFIWFFLPAPAEVLQLAPSDYSSYIGSAELKQQLSNVKFLHTANLNQDSHDFLLANGYTLKDLSFIKGFAPRNVSTQNDDYRSYYQEQEHLQQIYRLERLIFELFPQYQESYAALYAAASL